MLPATIELAGCEAQLLTGPAVSTSCAERSTRCATTTTSILLDCAPTLGVLTLNALTAADEVIVPLQCETLSHRGVGQLLDTVHDVQRLTNPNLQVLGVLPTLFDGRTNHTRAVLADVALRYGLDVLEPPIPRSVRFAEAPAVGKSIMRAGRRSPGAVAYRSFARSLVGLPPVESAPSTIELPDDAVSEFAEVGPVGGEQA